jgi:plastocyanin
LTKARFNIALDRNFKPEGSKSFADDLNTSRGPTPTLPSSLSVTMMFSSVLCLFSLPLLAAAQYGYGPNPSTGGTTAAAAAPVPTAPANTPGHININVGAGGLVYSPTNVAAPNGTIVTFYFPASPHSVTQSSFAKPCTYLAANGSAPAGFDSGITTGTQWSIKITNDAKPIWYFCKEAQHCGSGMVGSINAPATGNTFDAFHAAAVAIGNSEPTQTDGGPVNGGVNAQATAAPAAAVATGAAPAATTAAKTGGAVQLSAGAGAALLAVAAVFISA